MRHKRQAEMSAAEVCLREMNYFPYCSKPEEFIIQPYPGGLVKGNFRQNPKCFVMLTQMTHHLGIPHAVYGVKQYDKNGMILIFVNFFFFF